MNLKLVILFGILIICIILGILIQNKNKYLEAFSNKLAKIDGTELYFVHIPKNAGTSILKHLCNNEQIGHTKLKDINDINIAKNSIAVIRNPYDRLYSIYKYTQLGKKKSYWGINESLYDYVNSHTFEEFVNDLYLNNIKFEDQVHLLPQTEFIKWKDGKIHTKLIRFTHLNEDLSKYIDNNVSVPYTNKTHNKKDTWESHYTEDLKAKVQELYKDDFKLFQKYNIKESFQTQHSQIPIFYINLDRSIDKRDKMENQLKQYFNNYQRVSGVDGSKLNPNIYTNKINNNTSYNLKNFDGTIGRGNPSSVLGCLLSHIKTILLVDEKGYNNAVILEDDMDLQYYPKWNTTIETIINEAPDNWDIIKLFSLNQSKLKDDVNLLKKGIKYRKLPQNDIESEWSTGCYIINKRGISKIMKDIQNNEFKIDKNKYKHLVADYYLYKNKNVYEYTKPLVAPFQNNKSEIENNGVNSADEKCATFVKNFYSSV